jgi:hypothetical protein
LSDADHGKRGKYYGCRMSVIGKDAKCMFIMLLLLLVSCVSGGFWESKRSYYPPYPVGHRNPLLPNHTVEDVFLEYSSTGYVALYGSETILLEFLNKYFDPLYVKWYISDDFPLVREMEDGNDIMTMAMQMDAIVETLYAEAQFYVEVCLKVLPDDATENQKKWDAFNKGTGSCDPPPPAHERPPPPSTGVPPPPPTGVPPPPVAPAIAKLHVEAVSIAHLYIITMVVIVIVLLSTTKRRIEPAALIVQVTNSSIEMV